MLDIHGRFVIVGLPDEPLLGFNAMYLLGNGAFLGGSHIGSKKECIQMLYYAVPLNAKFALDGARCLRHIPIIRSS
jgi:alcohol dehydrogenase (NADP+)